MPRIKRKDKAMQAIAIAAELSERLVEYDVDVQTRRLALCAMIAAHLNGEYSEEEDKDAFEAVCTNVRFLKKSFAKEAA